MNSQRTVLHVEDDPNDAMLIARAFRKVSPQIRLDTAADGEKAIAYLSQTEGSLTAGEPVLPSLILLDLKLPRKTGVEVLAWIRAQPVLNILPVVMLTSSKQPSDIRRALAAGANAFVVKPLDYNELAATITNIFTFWLETAQPPPPAGV